MERNTMPILEVRQIHKYFPGVHALKGVSFDLMPGEVHALVGENGAGKSTLIKILSGIYAIDEGDYFIDGKPANVHNPLDGIQRGISVIYQELNNAPNLSIAENIYYGRLPQSYGRVQWKKLYTEAARCLDAVGLSVRPKLKLKYLSVAQQQLVEIAKAISLEARIIIMDEPTSALSPAEVQNLFKVISELKQKGVAIIYISHKLEEVFAVADRITVFRDGAVIGSAPARELNSDALIGMMVGRKMAEVFPEKHRSPGEVVFEARGLTTDKVDHLSFSVRRGEIVGFSGLMGAGRTEMTRAVFGLDKRISGDVLICGESIPRNNPIAARHAGIGLVTENRKDFGILPNLSVGRNTTIVALNQVSSHAVLNRHREEEVTRDIVSRLSIKTPSIEQLITKLSGGNQQKVMLARWLIKENLRLLIIDEPTRGIDVGAKHEIYSLMDDLAREGLSILMVSSELPEILGMCDRIYVMKEGRITAEIQGEEADEKLLLSKAI